MGDCFPKQPVRVLSAGCDKFLDTYYQLCIFRQQKLYDVMGFIKEFKEFAIKGNVIDLAVAVVIGGAFGKIVTSLVNDIIMPPIGLLLGDADFTSLFIPLDGNQYESLEAAAEAAAPVLAYGSFIQTVIEFLIIALAIFTVIKGINNLKKKKEAEPAAPPAPTPSEKLLEEIRDLLKTK